MGDAEEEHRCFRQWDGTLTLLGTVALVPPLCPDDFPPGGNQGDRAVRAAWWGHERMEHKNKQVPCIICPSVHPSFLPSTYLPFLPFPPSLPSFPSLSFQPSIYPSIHPSFHPPTCLFFPFVPSSLPSILPSIYPLTFSSFPSLSFHPSIYPSSQPVSNNNCCGTQSLLSQDSW